MGTSTSSTGPGGNVPFDPPWLDLVIGEQPAIGAGNAGEDQNAVGDGDDQAAGQGEGQEAEPALPTIAPPRRFIGARREMGAYARHGGTDALRRALGHYSKTGMGGASNVSNRMRVSSRVGAGLGSFLQAVRDGTVPEIDAWITQLVASNPSANDVITAIVQQVSTVGGSLDEESCKDSMAQAMSELLSQQPDIDLLNMSDPDIWMLMGMFLGHEACNRLEMDLGPIFESARISAVVAAQRTDNMRRYIKAEISFQIDALRGQNANPTRVQMQAILNEAVKNTFLVYEGELV